MPRAKRKNFETFSDGILSICETKERTLVRTKMQGVRFGHPYSLPCLLHWMCLKIDMNI